MSDGVTFAHLCTVCGAERTAPKARCRRCGAIQKQSSTVEIILKHNDGFNFEFDLRQSRELSLHVAFRCCLSSKQSH